MNENEQPQAPPTEPASVSQIPAEAPFDARSLPPEVSPEPSFPIVGIGASAGGLAAFEALFSGLPADDDPGMAFIISTTLNGEAGAR